MPRSSRHKSHKQHKHSSKEAREHSDSEEVVNFKDRKDREEVVVRVSRESASSEKRKLAAQSIDSKDVYSPGNGGLPEEYSASKRRKERSDASGVDRWNGGGEVGRGGISVGDKETKGESSRIDSEKGMKSKVSVDSKSNKSSRRHESSSEKKEMNPGSIVEIQEVKRSSNSSKAESKSKSEKSDKDSSRKEVHQYKDSKDKEHVSERSAKAQDVRRERSDDRGSGKGVVDNEGSRKQSSHLEDRLSKPEVEITDRLMQEELRNPELEKEMEKRMRRKRDGSDEKDKYVEDVRDLSGRRLSNRDERHKDEKHKEEKHKEDRYRDKHREDPDRDHRSRDDRGVRDHRSSKDHISDRSGSRHSRDENKLVIENHHKKPKTQNTDRDDSPHLDDRASKYKDYRGKKRSSEEDDRSDIKSRNTKDQRYEVEKKLSSGKVESLADRGRSQSRLADGDSTVSGRRRSSPSSGAHFSKDGFRHSSKQAESKYKDSASEERVRSSVTSSRELPSVSGVPERASESRSADKPKSMGKPIQFDKNHFAESERSPIIDVQVSPQMKEKSHSSTSIDRRHSNRTPVRRSLDIEENVHRSSKDVRDHSGIEDRGSQEWPLEKSTAEEFPQADGDTISVSSSYNRTNHLPTSSSSVLPPPPPLRTGVDSPSVFSSFEEDNRSKSSNRYKRPGDTNVGRVQGNAWKGVLNWSSPVTNGFIPFQPGPPPGGYHPIMQQFHGPPLFGVRPSMELNPTGVPYHIPDADRYSGHGRSFGWRNRADEACPPHLHGWDGGNGGFGDESHMHGKPDWDQNRHVMTDLGWDASADLWKGQNNGLTMDFPSASRKEDNQLRGPVDEAWGGKPGARSRNDRSRSVSRAESIEIKVSDDIPSEQVSIEASKQIVVEKTPEPLKTLNDNDFCQVYLSKLDISVDLTHPELYKQCKSLFKKEGILTDGDVTISTKKSGTSRQRISNTSLSSQLFPAIKDSVFQRAMILYKKQCEELKAKVPVLSVFGTGPKNVSSNDVEMLYSDATIIDQEQEPLPDLMEEAELIPTLTQADVEEPVPASDSEKADDPVISFNLEKMEDSVPTSGPEMAEELFSNLDQNERDEAVPKHSEEMVEPVPTYGSVASEEHASLINHMELKEADAKTAVNVKNLEDAEVDPLQHALSAIINSSNNMEDDTTTCDGKGNCSASIVRNNAFSDDTMCGFLGVTDGSEAFEALAPMSIECKSVNLSRIHSPESTH
ncbi:LOW protein: zinc finger CCCH domain protein [Thalictrum thalictroides]|uniref:LOW protein: zinc finger CCCH domain protein n=1 Tax=Thalictrum thalictroides TaxID=46969 RepID=A0A7J6V6I4_THATH|nr:LOW protein: zinc finger CCCH domain protein [Thalictrum thalictroides]